MFAQMFLFSDVHETPAALADESKSIVACSGGEFQGSSLSQ
jgi:hypothetical protein